MCVAHLAIASSNVRATSTFLCEVMGWSPLETPSNAMMDLAWIDISTARDRSQQIHVIHVADFVVSPFDREFGRHFAVFHDGHDMDALRNRLAAAGGELIEPLRATPFERFFFREPINGYVFEVIHREQWRDSSGL
jgi:predicted enzyme related to lactoylglutathione lyase